MRPSFSFSIVFAIDEIITLGFAGVKINIIRIENSSTAQFCDIIGCQWENKRRMRNEAG
jgi:hypothetical protein